MRGPHQPSASEAGTTLSLELRGVEQGPVVDGVEHLRLQTDAGLISCRYHEAAAGDAAVVWVSGAGGGLDGPAHGLYPRLAGHLVGEGIASLRLDYRHPNFIETCVLDTLLSIAYLGQRGRRRVALVGHSFGGAVAITAGALSESVFAVAALSSQTYGTELVAELSPRSLLLIHGAADEILSDDCARDLYQRACEPRSLLIYPDCGHGLDACRDRLDHDLTAWLRRALAPPL
jgi:alpha-beta hydrolase superfamily lysophospholipase